MAYRAIEPLEAIQCRVCRSSLAVDTKTIWPNIFTDLDAGQGGLLFIIKEVTGHEVKQEENLPQGICSSCLAAAKTALNFKRRFEKSLQLLKQNRLRNEDSLSDPPKKTHSVSKESENDNSEDSFNGEWSTKSIPNRKRQFECPHCSKNFPFNSSLTEHLRSHTGERPFVCTHCSKTFYNNGVLKRHLRTHTGERPFACSHCTKTFGQSTSLRYHLRTHTGERPYKCSHCTKTFGHNSDLKKHIRTHSGERPFKCEHCMKTFSQNGNLQKHILIHTGEQSYECSKCPKTFTQQEYLNYHLRTHTVERPYKCEHCSKSFSQNSYLKCHTRRIHMGEQPCKPVPEPAI